MIAWIKNGTQRAAVARHLRCPMTGTEILMAARQHAPRILLGDVWANLKTFAQRGLVQCLNPQDVCGRLFILTPLGRRIVTSAFDVETMELSPSIDYGLMAQLLRARTRLLVFHEVARTDYFHTSPKTGANLRRRMKQRQIPISINSVLRALQELQALELIDSASTIARYEAKVYALTAQGKLIKEELQRRRHFLPASIRQAEENTLN